MKNQKLTLSEYINYGGNVDKIDWSKAYSIYRDKNYKSTIMSFEDKMETNDYGEKLWHFTFKNGNTHRYALCWIIVNATFVLHESHM